METKLDASFTITLMDPKILKLACYQVLCPYARLRESGIYADENVYIYSHPQPLKLHSSLTKTMDAKSFSDPLATLWISFTPTVSLSAPLTHEDKIELNRMCLWRALDYAHTYLVPSPFSFGSFSVNRESRNNECERLPDITEEDLHKVHKNSIELSIDKFRDVESFACLGLLAERLALEERVAKVIRIFMEVMTEF